jgi:hypothetical protein
MLSAVDGMPKWSIALERLRRDKVVSTLHSSAGHHTKHSHIGT